MDMSNARQSAVSAITAWQSLKDSGRVPPEDGSVPELFGVDVFSDRK